MWTTALHNPGTTRMVAPATPRILAKDRDDTRLQIDPNRALLAAGNDEADGEPNGEITEKSTPDWSRSQARSWTLSEASATPPGADIGPRRRRGPGPPPSHHQTCL